MKKNTFLILILLVFIVMLSGCAHIVDISACTEGLHIYGFWGGLWHGIISPFTFIGSLFSDNVTIYAVNNNGGWYNFGFVLGAGILGGGTVKASR